MIDTVRAYEPTPPAGRPSIYNTLPHPITFEQKNPEDFEEGHIFNKAVLCIAQDILDEGIAKLPKEIADKGIVVASSNNGAVKNIVNELPQRKEIYQKLNWLDELKKN